MLLGCISWEGLSRRGGRQLARPGIPVCATLPIMRHTHMRGEYIPGVSKGGFTVQYMC